MLIEILSVKKKVSIFLGILTFLLFIPTVFATIELDSSQLYDNIGLVNVTGITNQVFTTGFAYFSFSKIGNCTTGGNNNSCANHVNFTFIVENQTDSLAGYGPKTFYSPGLRGYDLGGQNQPTFNINNTSLKLRAEYNLTLNVTDSFGNTSKFFLREIKFIENTKGFSHAFFTTNATNETLVNTSITTSTAFHLKMKNFLNGTFDIALYNFSPDGVNFSSSALGKYIEVSLEPNVSQNLDWAFARLYYTDQDLSQNGITNESALAFYVFNETTNQWEKVSGSGDDATNNFVYMNITHFSTYGVFVEPSSSSSSQSSTSPSGGGGTTAVPVTTTNQTNATHIIITEKIDCSNISLPNGSICNETGIYIPSRMEIKEVETPILVFKETLPVWIYGIFAILILLIIILLWKLTKFKK